MSGYGLYKWKKTTDSKVYSKNQRITSDCDIQNWIKTVELASDNAVAETFRESHTSNKARSRAKTVKKTIDDVHLHDASYVEAKELLDEWVNSKVDFKAEDVDYTVPVQETRTQYDVKREWDHLLERNGEEIPGQEEEYWAKYVNAYKPTTDPYGILERQTEDVVDDILQDMLEKDVIGENAINNLGLEQERSKVDPRLKMQLRHKQVKENREKRELVKEKKLQEQQQLKDTQFKARQIVKKEEAVKARQAKREERHIQGMMTQIRKDMSRKRLQEQQKKIQEDIDHEHEQEQLAKLQQYEAQTILTARSQLNAEQLTRERAIKQKIQQAQTRATTERLKLSQRCFSAWYGVVIERRLQLSKATAMSDWKCLIRAWNAWLNYTRCRKLDEETWKHELELRKVHRKQTIAQSHHMRAVQKKYFHNWRSYVEQCVRDKELKHARKITQSKMAAFLQAASKTTEVLSSTDESDTESDITNQTDSTNQKLDALFATPFKKPLSGRTRSENTSARRNTPQEAFQVKRKHVTLTKEELKIAQQKKIPATSQSNCQVAVNKPWLKQPYSARNFENRHSAQQKILSNQQKQIEEQHRLITEMQYLQRQQILQQELVQQQLKANSEKDNLNLQKHLTNLQNELDNKAMEIVTQRSDNSQDHGFDSSRLTTDRSDFTTVTPASTPACTPACTPASTARSNASQHDRFVNAMEKRAEERAKLKKEREEKRRKQEQEKLERLEAEQKELRQKERAEKMKRIQAHREKKMIDQQREQEQQKELELYRQQITHAHNHYIHSCVLYRGWLPWRKLIAISRHKTELAMQHYKLVVQRKCLLYWHEHISQDLERKTALARRMHCYIVVRRCFINWKKVGEISAIAEVKAKQHFEIYTKSRVLQVWADYAAEEKIATWRKERKSKEHNIRRLKLTALRIWRKYPQLLRDEKKREIRREEMRKKVASMLPDYNVTEKSTDSYT